MVEAQMIIAVFVFLIGLVVGSFLNVCIVRLPKEESVVQPPSHCVHCKTPILWYDNIPVFSFIFLGGKCRFCRRGISFRYPLVEFTAAISFLGLYLYFGWTGFFFAYTVMVSGFIVATFVDFEHRIIPDEISVGGMAVGVFLSFVFPELHGMGGEGILPHLKSLGWSVLGVLIGGGSIYLMGLLGDAIFRKESMGGGDVKLMAMVGAFMGWKLALLAFFIAPFFGAVYGIIEKIRTKDSAIAYGPFLVLGSLIALFWGDQIISWLLGRYGIF
ncbi:MAG: prepilin peptidase [Candidatus Omnitrophica bacterium]|nr:prepilin peptidase [Candidatus Omnitrophota bacterium]